jgi:hypothetical protein
MEKTTVGAIVTVEIKKDAVGVKGGSLGKKQEENNA